MEVSGPVWLTTPLNPTFRRIKPHYTMREEKINE
jgi:hypothetical protein